MIKVTKNRENENKIFYMNFHRKKASGVEFTDYEGEMANSRADSIYVIIMTHCAVLRLATIIDIADVTNYRSRTEYLTPSDNIIIAD